MNIGENIATLRHTRGLTQSELGAILKVSASTISSWENGHTEPPAKMKRKICKVMDCTESDLRNGKNLLPKNEIILTPDELGMILRYRAINPRDREKIQEIVSFLFCRETEPLRNEELVDRKKEVMRKILREL